MNYLWYACSPAITDADEHTQWLTGLYIQRRCKLCIIISPVVNGHDFGVSWGFLGFQSIEKKNPMPAIVDEAACKRLSQIMMRSL